MQINSAIFFFFASQKLIVRLSPGGLSLPNQINFSHVRLAHTHLLSPFFLTPRDERAGVLVSESFLIQSTLYFSSSAPCHCYCEEMEMKKEKRRAQGALSRMCFVVPPVGSNFQSHPHEIINLIISACRVRKYFPRTLRRRVFFFVFNSGYESWINFNSFTAPRIRLSRLITDDSTRKLSQMFEQIYKLHPVRHCNASLLFFLTRCLQMKLCRCKSPSRRLKRWQVKESEIDSYAKKSESITSLSLNPSYCDPTNPENWILLHLNRQIWLNFLPFTGAPWKDDRIFMI